jgi:hypothetical protein
VQFVKKGPDIPERLLQAHEDGRVVFFCGAGISYPARLPDFNGLVKALFASLGELPSPTEQAAIKTRQYDTAIGLLEERIVGRRTAVREHIARILTPALSAPDATANHEALLTLSLHQHGGFRLITTNFDRLFEIVRAKLGLEFQMFQAPLLPVPKNRLDGLVYLHGLLPASPAVGALESLVLSSGDFGRAYLTERWAARFVTELFRNYTVCFVGYSISDPVLRYMMDGLAADRLLGESSREMFAFGSFSTGKEEESANEWKAKNVTPILYRGHGNHAFLTRTLTAWSEIHRAGVLGKERIAVEYALAKPLGSTKQDDFVGRMLWALSDPCGLPAKRFAEATPAPPIEWLDPLADSRFKHEDLIRFGVSPNPEVDEKLTFSLVQRPTPYVRASWMTLVEGAGTGPQWDAVMHQIARWLTRHLHDPKLILWFANRGGTVHPEFARLITEALEEHPISQPMELLWRVMLAGRLRRPRSWPNLDDWHVRFTRYGLTPTLRLEFRDLLSPRVRLREPFRGLDAVGHSRTSEATSIKDLVDWDIVLATEHVHTGMRDLTDEAGWQEVLPQFLSDATGLLRDTLDLMRELGGVNDQHDMSYMHRPSISDHPQNQHFRDWTALIELTRDAWLKTADSFPEQARREVERWLDIPYPLFRRLVFFAATETRLFSPRQAIAWLLMDEHWWLWSLETEREVLRLLVKTSSDLESQEREVLERAILQGPPRKMFRDDIDPESLQRSLDRKVWLLIAKYTNAGGSVGRDVTDRLKALSQQYPSWQLAADQRDEFPVWIGQGGEWQKRLATPKAQPELVQWLREHPISQDWQEDDWRERCKEDFTTTVSALSELAKAGNWPPGRIREALQAWADEKLAALSWREFGAALVTAPEHVIKDIAHSLGRWLQAIPKDFDVNEDGFFTLIRRVLRLNHEEVITGDNDDVFRAINHPIGMVTEAALLWWFRQAPEDGQGLPHVLKDIFTNLSDTNLQQFRHGRLLLGTHVIALFRVDQAWTTECVLPLFDWDKSSEEARAAWKGFLWSPRFHRPLMQAIKKQFLATAQKYAELGEHGEVYANFLTYVALEPADIFSTNELKSAMHSLPTDGLENAAEALVSALDAAGERRGEYWQDRILPYLKFVLPKSLNKRTPAVSERFARLSIKAEDHFPNAIAELKHWLIPLDYPNSIVHALYETKLSERFPEPTLALLDAIIGKAALFPPRNLKDCLASIENVQPDLKDDKSFQKLSDYLRRHGQD